MRIFACVQVDRSTHSGSADRISVSLLGQQTELASADMGSPGQPGDTFIHFANRVPGFPQAAVGMVTLGVRGEDLLRIADLVVWTTSDTADGPHPLVIGFPDATPGPAKVSADPAEGRLFETLRRVETAPQTAMIGEVVVAAECWTGHESGATMSLVLRRSDGSAIEELPLPGLERLQPGEARIWRLRLAAPVKASTIFGIGIRNTSGRSAVLRLVSVFGRAFRRNGLPRAAGLASSGDTITINSATLVPPRTELRLSMFVP